MKNMAKTIAMHPEIQSIYILCEEEQTVELVGILCRDYRYGAIAVSTTQKKLQEKIEALLEQEKIERKIIWNDKTVSCEALYFDAGVSYNRLMEYAASARYLYGIILYDQVPYFTVWEQFRTQCKVISLWHINQNEKMERLQWEAGRTDIELSIVFPVYKVEDYLDTCIQSVIQWKAPYIEYLFVDDGSPDQSAEIIERYAQKDKRIQLIRKKNGGCASARKEGLARAKGRYVGFVDPDDFIDPSMFRKLLARALMGNYQIAYCGYNKFYESTKMSEQVEDAIDGIYAEGLTDQNKIQELIMYMRVAIWRGIYRNDFLKRNHITFNESFRRFDDLPFKVEVLSKARSAAAIPEHLYFYRLERPGQDVSCDDERLYVHFDIFAYLDKVIRKTGNQRLIDYLQVVKVQTHLFALENIQKKYLHAYLVKAKKDLRKNCGTARTMALVYAHAGARTSGMYFNMLLGMTGTCLLQQKWAVQKQKAGALQQQKSLDSLQRLYNQLGWKLQLPDAFFQAEVREGYLVTEKMKKVWAVELDLLSQLLHVCGKHNLKVYADAGTLLGAVRHHGFIPWDDDIDVVMFREDYDRLLTLTPEFGHPYFLQSVYSDKGYTRGHAQLRNSSTTGILASETDEKFHQGIFIDIFVLDGVPKEPEKRELEKKQINWLKKCIWHAAHKVELVQDTNIKIPEEVLQENTVEAYFGYLEKRLRAYPVSEAEQVFTLSFSYETEKAWDKHLYDKVLWMDFENLKVPIPAGYKTRLKMLYGEDYMIPRQADTLHGEVIFEPEIPYDVYLADLHREQKRSAGTGGDCAENCP